jgi:hypothetical protein
MRPVGFSTGALARGDFRRAIALLEGVDAPAIELSALRLAELGPLMAAASSLAIELGPHHFDADEERAVAHALMALVPLGWPIVLHPDTIHDYGPWRPFGAQLVIENMDKRKPHGRHVEEMRRVFAELPEAGFCFDLGHARQIDRTMSEAYFLVTELGARLRQLHVSEVNTRCRHDPLSRSAVAAFQKVARWIPDDVPVILETPVASGDIASQITMAREALPEVRSRATRPALAL